MTATPARPDSSKQKGTGFPVISLPEAVKIIREAGSHGRSHSLVALAGYAGHTSHTSGPFGAKLAALRTWGLIVKSADRVTLTDSAMSIALPTSEENYRSALLQAFRNCDVFWKVYSDSMKGRPLEITSIGNTVVANLGVTISSKEKFVRSMIDSAEAVGLARRDSAGKIVFLSDARASAPSIQIESTALDGEQTYPNPVQATQQDSRDRNDRRATTPIVHQVFELTDGEILFEIMLKGPIPSRAFAQLGNVVQEIEALSSMLEPAKESNDRLS